MVVKHVVEGPNFYRVDIGTLSFWFSFDTIIAFQANACRRVCENVWTRTTAKHLNALDGGGRTAKAARLSYKEFGVQLDALADRLGERHLT